MQINPARPSIRLASLAARLAAKAALTLIAMAAAMFAVATPASARLVWIPRAARRIAAYIQPGRGPAIVLCHGFPDNHHLYDHVVLVAHDASVPAVLNWTLDHPGRVASMILSNGFYAPVAGSGPPALAAIFALGQYSNAGPLGPLPPGTAYGLNSLMNGMSSDPR